MEKTLGALAELVEGAEIIGNSDTLIKDIEHDSRKVTEGTLFACIAGAHVDGHTFIPQAREKGAVAIITDNEDAPMPAGMDVLLVPDLSKALKVIVPFFYDYPARRMRVIGITGTNGKTSISYMIRSMLRKMGFRVGLIGTIQIMIEDEVLPIHNTTPDVVELQATINRMLENNMDYVVMEVSSHALDQDRVAGVEFDTVVFTNLTQDHLDYHKTFENYRSAKAKLFDSVSRRDNVKNGKTAVVNIDDEAGRVMLEHADCRHITYGIDNDAVLRAENIQVLADGTRFDIRHQFGTLPLDLKITGIFNVYNVMAAVGAALAEGIPVPVIKAAMEEFTGVPGRFELVRGGQDFAVIVDYAHTPDGLENILHTARKICDNRIITVFGCGGDRDRTKRPIMGRIAAELSDVIVATSDNPRTEDPAFILGQVVEGVEQAAGDKEHEAIIDRREAIFHAVNIAKKGDIVVIAGKGHEDYQILKDKTIHFDDKEVAMEAIKGKIGE
ncbi:MAG: UDP-N-acetylmuramoyl-L-alanyl-D-glutamate--2,6-diaminopimelate ligase [Anaerovibrio sp.]|uniref:UDP-N-acetylmuramoyl-L-alanyl-D-glutamate--2, 6-diaminopimelate ligase n=1 Tax=Anaerovibrio sp. TaxID=1872532 RepID=UPI0025DFA077|nr:UDP-N-acetylmuramoyl-L-alanyl-D-glutamate--2,6-diaminopimelate ligase [Anaerovibrio sp.]MCR5175397.1 UDP-N-acetylmuramoyl-L-alanyl-D-glutamate--2,6-diaminopimelate ligase [Anaerovibrio sp.]